MSGLALYGWIIAAYSVSVTGDVLIKQGSPWIGAILYAASTPFWVRVIQARELSTVAIMSSIIGNTMLLLAARFFLGEVMTPQQWVGIAIGMVALAFLA